jgi:hypothetical protein
MRLGDKDEREGIKMSRSIVSMFKKTSGGYTASWIVCRSNSISNCFGSRIPREVTMLNGRLVVFVLPLIEKSTTETLFVDLKRCTIAMASCSGTEWSYSRTSTCSLSSC